MVEDVSETVIGAITVLVIVVVVVAVEATAAVPHESNVLSKFPLVILTQYICPVAESVISRPLVTEAVCVSMEKVLTSVNTARVAWISPTVHEAADETA